MIPQMVASVAVLGWALIGSVSYRRALAEAGQQPVTLATVVTAIRGGLAAALLGFAVTAPMDGSVVWSWVPVVCFVAAGLLDAVDGWVARQRNARSRFGERLDVEADGLLVFAGAVLVVTWGRAPIWVLLVGLARYIYVLAVMLRERRGRPVGDDPAGLLNRLSYATMLSALAIGLLPVVDPGVSRPLLAVVAVVFLGNFLRDWLAKTRVP